MTLPCAWPCPGRTPEAVNSLRLLEKYATLWRICTRVMPFALTLRLRNPPGLPCLAGPITVVPAAAR